MNGSNVHEVFTLMTTLLGPYVPIQYLELCGQILQRRQMEQVFEERAAAKRCGLPTCDKVLMKSARKLRVSLARREIYDAHYEQQFCSSQCLKKARVLLSQLAQKPPQLVPSLLDVFGTESPNPLDYEDGTIPIHTNAVSLATQTREPMPKIRSVWAKTQNLGIVEREHSKANWIAGCVPPKLKAKTSFTLKENETPAPPDRNFPTKEHAMLIEGYVFPAHKQKLARKVEKIVKKSQDRGDDDDIVVSDSDESDAAASDVSSAGSFEISDFDDDEVVKLNDLPLFSHLWGLFSDWITHETTLVVAGQSLLSKTEEKDDRILLVGGPSETEADVAHRRARQYRLERWNSLLLMLRCPLSQVALQLQLASDRFANHRIDTITKTFALRDAIGTQNTHEWTCIATILMLVAYNIKPDELAKGERSDQVHTLTKMDSSELCQLLQLFYKVRKNSDVAVDTNVASVHEDMSIGKNSANGETCDKPVIFCRKCRRAKSKCVCDTRAKVPKEEELSADKLEGMLQEALVLRDDYNELMQSGD